MNPFFESTPASAVSVGVRAAPPPARRQHGDRMRHFYRAARALALAAGLAASQPLLAASVDVNTATAVELETIRGIGAKTAQTIISERERSGPFDSMQDFAERIRGVGPKRAQSFQEAGLTVGGTDVKAGAPR